MRTNLYYCNSQSCLSKTLSVSHFCFLVSFLQQPREVGTAVISVLQWRKWKWERWLLQGHWASQQCAQNLHPYTWAPGPRLMSKATEIKLRHRRCHCPVCIPPLFLLLGTWPNFQLPARTLCCSRTLSGLQILLGWKKPKVSGTQRPWSSPQLIHDCCGLVDKYPQLPCPGVG